VEQVFVAELLSVTGSTIPTFPHIQPFIFLWRHGIWATDNGDK
jgi:hypothetical protein